MRAGRLQEAPNIVIWLGNFWYFGKLVPEERWLQLEVRLCGWSRTLLHTCTTLVKQVNVMLETTVAWKGHQLFFSSATSFFDLWLFFHPQLFFYLRHIFICNLFFHPRLFLSVPLFFYLRLFFYPTLFFCVTLLIVFGSGLLCGDLKTAFQ